MSHLDDDERDALSRALRDAVPQRQADRGRAAGAELLGRQLRRRRQGAALLGTVAVVAAIVVAPTIVDRLGDQVPQEGTSPSIPATTEVTPSGGQAVCKGGTGALHTDLTTGDPVFIQFCPPPGTWNGVVASPHEALIDGVDELVSTWAPEDLHRCTRDPVSDQFRFQIVYSDGSYAQMTGATGDCQPIVNGDQTIVGTGDEMFGQIMAAYGAQYASRFNAVDDPTELTCPSDLLDPGQTDKGGPSASLASNGLLMSLPPTRGLLCTPGGSVPLDAATAERVRVALQSITGGDFDCAPGADPTYAVVLEDKTGTRRTVSSDGSQCGAIITAFRGGLSGAPGDYLLRLLGELS